MPIFQNRSPKTIAAEKRRLSQLQAPPVPLPSRPANAGQSRSATPEEIAESLSFAARDDVDPLVVKIAVERLLTYLQATDFILVKKG